MPTNKPVSYFVLCRTYVLNLPQKLFSLCTSSKNRIADKLRYIYSSSVSYLIILKEYYDYILLKETFIETNLFH